MLIAPVACSGGSDGSPLGTEPAPLRLVRVAARPHNGPGAAPGVSEVRQSVFRMEDELVHTGIDSMGGALPVLVTDSVLIEGESSDECAVEFDFRTARRLGPDEAETGLSDIEPAPSESDVLISADVLPADLQTVELTLAGTAGTYGIAAVTNTGNEPDSGLTAPCALIVSPGRLNDAADLDSLRGEVWVTPSEQSEEGVERLRASLSESLADDNAWYVAGWS